ncbi:MAG: metal ABC transporter permease [Paracoccaceae bacterium]
MSSFISALLLQSGYNAALVCIGAALLGAAAGATGTFLFLRKRALVSDAIAHGTLPGVALAYLAMVYMGGSGRNLAGLLGGAAASAGLGLLAVNALSRRTRLAEDAAIGAVLSVFFGFGVVLLTVIQTLNRGQAAGLEGFLLGSTAGMLRADAIVIALGGALAVGLVLALRRPFAMIAFDPGYAAAAGLNVPRFDLLLMLLVMAVTVVGLKIVGLILIIAMLIIPPVSARFWSDRTDRVLLIAAIMGAASAYTGAALSASAPDLPTGAVIVLMATGLFLASLLFAPGRGLLAVFIAARKHQTRVHLRQGLLALAHGERIFDGYTLQVLRRAGFIRPDGVATPAGQTEGARALRDEARWRLVRRQYHDEAITQRYDGLTPIETVLTPDEITLLDQRLEAAHGR